MSILGIAFMPHPPVVIPEVAPSEEEKVEKTFSAMQKVGEEINMLGPHTILCFSPHGSLQPEHVGWSANSMLVGDLGEFGAADISQEYKNNLPLVEQLCSELDDTRGYEHPGDTGILDHGALVPLSFVDKDNGSQLVYGGYCYKDGQFHYEYGKHLGNILHTSDDSIYIIASGDLSHRLSPEAPAGYDPDAHKFDELIVKITHDNNWEAIATIPDDLIEKAGECGFRSFAMFAGLVHSMGVTAEVLSYEAPFGVGYMVAKT